MPINSEFLVFLNNYYVVHLSLFYQIFLCPNQFSVTGKVTLMLQLGTIDVTLDCQLHILNSVRSTPHSPHHIMAKHTSPAYSPVSYTHLDVYKRQVYKTG